MIPTLNVNLDARHTTCSGDEHFSKDCAPILIPCPIPRSVTFEVRLGECSCVAHGYGITKPNHAADCPARPIRVSCSISGKAWEESEVVEGDRMGSTVWADWDNDVQREAALTVCRERWALVKALVLGKDPRHDVIAQALHTIHRDHRFFEQRDALYAELAALARDEQSAVERQERAVKAMGEATFMPDNFYRAEPIARASASILARYVERLVEQVGVL